MPSTSWVAEEAQNLLTLARAAWLADLGLHETEAPRLNGIEKVFEKNSNKVPEDLTRTIPKFI